MNEYKPLTQRVRDTESPQKREVTAAFHVLELQTHLTLRCELVDQLSEVPL